MIQPTVLLVESDPIVRKVFRATLARAGYEILEAIDGRTAFDIIAEEQIDLVIQDLRLPDMHGIDLAEHIRELHALEALPIIAVSSVSSTLQRAHVLDTVFNEFLLKPVEPSKLTKVVRSYLPLGDDAQQLPGGHRLVLVADSDVLQRRGTSIRFRRKGFRVREATDGEEALEKAMTEPPTAIVADVLLPRLDGFRLCQTLRETPALARVPVILISSRPVGAADRRMALAAGASAYIKRSASCEEAIDKVLNLVDRKPSAALNQKLKDLARPRIEVKTTDGSTVDVGSSDYRARLIRQLERQAQITTELTRVTNLQAAQLSVLAGVSETLTRTLDLQAALEEALARCMDVSVFSLGAAFLVEGDELVLAASHGFPEEVEERLGDFFGYEQLLVRALDEAEIITVPSQLPGLKVAGRLLAETSTRGMQLVPLCVGESRLGVLVLASLKRDMRKRGFAFARTIQGQLAQAIQLGYTLDRLSLSEQRFRRAAEAVPEGMLISDREGRLTFMNAAARALFGVRTEAQLTLQDLLPGIDSANPNWEGVACALNGSAPVVRVSTSLMVTGHELERTHLVQDVTDARAAEAVLRSLAEHDSLTGLLNRRSFVDRLAAELLQNNDGAVLFIDLDGFKAINDTHGHGAGDLVLERLADTLKSRLRGTDVVARIGGDEFAVLQPAARDREALALGNLVLRTVRGLMTHIDGQAVTLGASIGAVLFPRDGDTAADLIERADRAMYEAKRTGGNQVVIWAPGTGEERSSGPDGN